MKIFQLAEKRENTETALGKYFVSRKLIGIFIQSNCDVLNIKMLFLICYNHFFRISKSSAGDEKSAGNERSKIGKIP